MINYSKKNCKKLPVLSPTIALKFSHRQNWLKFLGTSGLVENSITRAKKEQIVKKLKWCLENSMLAVSIKFQGVTVGDLQDFRRSLPPDARFMVAKNTLVQLASNEKDGWSTFAQFSESDSGVLFVGNNIADAIKAYEDFITKLDKASKKDIFTVQGGVLDGQVLTPDDVLKLRTLPTKKELITKLAVALRMVPTRTASTLNALPSKLARSINEVCKLDQDKTKRVLDFESPKNVL